MEERRLLVAVALSLLVLTAYSLLFAPPKRAPAPAATPAPREAARPAAEASPIPAAPPVPASPAPPARVVLDAKEKRIEVGAPDYSVAFTNKGARLLSWTLARYRDARGQPEEIVPAASGGVRPLDIETGDPAVDTRLRAALYQASSETLTLAAGAKEPQTLRFEFADGEIEAQKTLRFGTTGLVAVTVAVERAGRPLPCRLVWGPGIGNATPEEREVRGYQPPQGVALTGNRVELLVASKLGPTGQALSAVRWVGVESQYFAALLIPTGAGAGAEIRPAALPARPDEKPEVAPVAVVDATGAQPTLLFVGAKDYTAMAPLGYELQRVVPVGDWLGPIVVPLIRLLRWVQRHVGNWGWSIVFLTVLINVVMAPFRHYSIVNGLKMAKISPR